MDNRNEYDERQRELHDIASEDAKETIREIRQAETKYVYYLLGVAAAATAFVLQQTKESPFRLPLLVAFLAVSAWLGSGWCGIRTIQHTIKHFNALLWLSNRARQLATNINAMPVDTALKNLREAGGEAKFHEHQANEGRRWQFNLLCIGALAYVTWHLLEMACRTFPAWAVNVAGVVMSCR